MNRKRNLDCVFIPMNINAGFSCEVSSNKLCDGLLLCCYISVQEKIKKNKYIAQLKEPNREILYSSINNKT